MSQPNARRSDLGGATGIPRGAAVVFLLLTALPSGARSDDARERTRPPGDLPCPRAELTLYEGAVARYERSETRVEFTVETDWDTKEEVVMRAPDAASLTKRLRLDGKPFAAADWAAIETRAGELRDGVRVKIWLCRKGSTATPERIDWQRPPAP
jgi:hypothetical protein